jgi:carbon starvation protein
MFSAFVSGGGPIVKGPLFPFVFITIACGAISGFHSLVASGTTPKMIDKETQCRPIGYGAMLMESLVGVTALIAACSLPQANYFQINLKPEDFAALAATMHFDHGSLSELAQLVGESTLAGRTGGGVSLAAGIARIFGNFPGFGALMGYFYHFVIMFEALFVLTTIDTGTRIARFLVQECSGRFYKPMARTDWIPGTVVASAVVVAAWSYFIYTGTIQTLWPMFGVANQLLAIVALTVGTSVLINEGKAKYAWVTLAPMLFVGATTLSAGFLSIKDIFIPMMAKNLFQGVLLSTLTGTVMLCVFVVLADAAPRWLELWHTGRAQTLENLRLPSREAAEEERLVGIIEPSL